MRAFSQLLDDLVYTRSRNTKLRLIGDYLKETPDPDRGLGTGRADRNARHPARQAGRDPRAWSTSGSTRAVQHEPRLCRRHGRNRFAAVAEVDGEPPEVDDATIRISDAIERLRSASKLDAPRVLASMLDHLDASGRYALLKLALGELRVGVNARLAKQALADAFGLEVEAVEEVWHGLPRPSPSCSTGRKDASEQPSPRDVPVFRPFMLAHPLEETRISLEDYAAEWKWDGIRVQLVHAGGETRLYSRTGDDISRQLPRRRRGFSNQGRARRRAAGARNRPGRCRRPRRRRGKLQCAPAAARAQERQPEDAWRLSRVRAAVRYAVRRR